ncbi:MULTISPECIES: hypothetical protein [Lactiplantibacillus]|uniref:Uncharacterized protein n=1 Tax=Lactiplantibacillus pentosus TaxID=1589 RepID=A0A2S9VIW4_LACPE|nr:MULTISPECIES: hypothetical protein [Lactiplantibacillus]MCH4130588.1 hypothetical protein [Lactiplantibacillus sp.]BBM20146.1 uncharacterized protein SN13T_0135 [Lactiplantibacillus plantarum]MBU7460941.1 hypothetical protein [Lactiplantibacillus pentosus]MBU7476287.1 hypothetical protein [Lactiplantibacillus pentosus]MBU7483531.1 hypothetical protein [Lactiplantibacillus sp. 30.2.29]
MALRSWQFNEGDIDFIEQYYPDLYQVLEPTMSKDRRSVAMKSDEQWDRIENLFVDEIALSADKNGELTENGLRIEAILDFA